MKDQKDCLECLSIRPGKPRCGYCLSDLIAELHTEAEALRQEVERYKTALLICKGQRNYEIEHHSESAFDDMVSELDAEIQSILAGGES